MATFGAYESFDELHPGRYGPLLKARLPTSRERFVVKVFDPPQWMVSAADLPGRTEEFLDAARLQQQMGQGRQWAPILEIGKGPTAFFVTPEFDNSVQFLVDTGVRLRDEALQHVAMSIVRGLTSFRNTHSRPHGNLKASNVLIRGEGDVAKSTFVLTDPAPTAHIKDLTEADDLRELGAIIQSLFVSARSGRRSAAKSNRKAAAAEARWRKICDRLTDPHHPAGPYTLDELRVELLRKPRSTRVPWKKLLAGIGAAILVIGVLIGFRTTRHHANWARLCDWHKNKDDLHTFIEREAQKEGVELDPAVIAGRPRNTDVSDDPPSGSSAMTRTVTALETIDRISGRLPKDPRHPFAVEELVKLEEALIAVPGTEAEVEDFRNRREELNKRIQKVGVRGLYTENRVVADEVQALDQEIARWKADISATLSVEVFLNDHGYARALKTLQNGGVARAKVLVDLKRYQQQIDESIPTIQKTAGDDAVLAAFVAHAKSSIDDDQWLKFVENLQNTAKSCGEITQILGLGDWNGLIKPAMKERNDDLKPPVFSGTIAEVSAWVQDARNAPQLTFKGDLTMAVRAKIRDTRKSLAQITDASQAKALRDRLDSLEAKANALAEPKRQIWRNKPEIETACTDLQKTLENLNNEILASKPVTPSIPPPFIPPPIVPATAPTWAAQLTSIYDPKSPLKPLELRVWNEQLAIAKAATKSDSEFTTQQRRLQDLHESLRAIDKCLDDLISLAADKQSDPEVEKVRGDLLKMNELEKDDLQKRLLAQATEATLPKSLSVVTGNYNQRIAQLKKYLTDWNQVASKLHGNVVWEADDAAKQISAVETLQKHPLYAATKELLKTLFGIYDQLKTIQASTDHAALVAFAAEKLPVSLAAWYRLMQLEPKPDKDKLEAEAKFEQGLVQAIDAIQWAKDDKDKIKAGIADEAIRHWQGFVANASKAKNVDAQLKDAAALLDLSTYKGADEKLSGEALYNFLLYRFREASNTTNTNLDGLAKEFAASIRKSVDPKVLVKKQVSDLLLALDGAGKGGPATAPTAAGLKAPWIREELPNGYVRYTWARHTLEFVRVGDVYICRTEMSLGIFRDVRGGSNDLKIGGPLWTPPDEASSAIVRVRGPGNGLKPSNDWTIPPNFPGLKAALYDPPNTKPSPPTDDHPMQLISPQAAIAFCGLLGCRFPTQTEWLAALTQNDSVMPKPKERLRTATWALQKTGLSRFGPIALGQTPWGDGVENGVFVPFPPVEPTATPAASGFLFFDTCDPPGETAPFHYLRGNVAEFVTGGAVFGSLHDAITGALKVGTNDDAKGKAVDETMQTSIKKGEILVIGGSAMSTYPPDKGFPLTGANVIATRTGWSDVGFRLAFDAPAGGGGKSIREIAKEATYLGSAEREFKNSIGMSFVRIEPGTFMMGSPVDEVGEAGRIGDETQHKVTLTRAYWMQTTTVTQAQWKAVMRTDPSHFKGDTLPVESVSWNDAVEFCRALSEKERKQYRLPTEAEWEYACRAGTATPFNTGDMISTDQANYNGNEAYGNAVKGVYRQTTTPVGSFKANAWGLFDMHGNVCQWCSDGYGKYSNDVTTDPTGTEGASSRVLRGGSWNRNPQSCRSAIRYGVAPGNRNYVIGFRVCLDFP